MPLVLLLVMMLPQIWAIHQSKGAAVRLDILVISTLFALLVMVSGSKVIATLFASRNAYNDSYYIVSTGPVLLVVALSIASFLGLVHAATHKAGQLPKTADVLASLLAVILCEKLLRLSYLPLFIATNPEGLQIPHALATFIRLIDVAFWGTLLALAAICVMVLLRRPSKG